MNNCWIDTEFFDRYKLEKGWDKEMKAKAAYVLAIWKIKTLLDELKEAENETNTNTES